jgi:hypothetical protein
MVRITQIVLDFIQDLEGRVWLFNCKFIDMDLTRSMSDYLSSRIDNNEE